MAVSNNIVPWFFGEEYGEVSLLMKVLAPLVVFIGISNVTGIQYLVPVGRQRDYTLSVISGSVVNLILNSILIPMYQSLGASIASICAEFTVMVVQLYIVRTKISISSILKLSSKYFVAGIIMFMSLSLIGKYLKPSITSTLLLVVIGFVIYTLTLLLERDRMVKEFLNIRKKD